MPNLVGDEDATATPGPASLASPSVRPCAHQPLACQRDISRPHETHRGDHDSAAVKFASLPALLLRGNNMSHAESFTDGDSASLDATLDEIQHAPGSSMRNMLNNLQRSSASAGASTQPVQRLRCPAMTTAVMSSPAADPTPTPSKLPLTSGGPLAPSDAVQQRVAKLFLQPGTSSAQPSSTPEHSSPAPIAQATHRVKQSVQTRLTSAHSCTTLLTCMANELDISSTTESTTMFLSSPRSVLGVSPETPPGEPRPHYGAPKPSWDESRVSTLHSLHLLRTPPEAQFDRITSLVAQARPSTPPLIVLHSTVVEPSAAVSMASSGIIHAHAVCWRRHSTGSSNEAALILHHNVFDVVVLYRSWSLPPPLSCGVAACNSSCVPCAHLPCG